MKKYFINVQGGTGLNVSLTQVISELTEKIQIIMSST
jgi:hypothetical protein